MAGYPRSRLTSLLIGTMNDDGTAVPDVPIPVPSQADARNLFGYGSMLDAMVEFFTKNNYAQELWVVPIAQAAAGVVAAGTITVTAAAVSAGTLPVYIAGRRVQVFVAAGEAVDETATKIADAITADLSMPVTALAAAGVVTLTSKWRGVEANDIDVRMAYGGLLAAEQVPVGLTITLSGNKLTGGTGSPDIAQALTNLGDEIYEYVATGFTDSTSLALLEEEYGFGDEGRWGWLRQLYGHVFAAKTGAAGAGDQTGYSDLLTYGPSNNSGVLSIMGVEHNSPTPPWSWAAAYTAKAARALLNDPARPLQTLALDGCLPAPKHQRFTMKQCNDLAGVGIATQGINGDGVPSIKRESTTYQKNLYGQGDDAYELVPTLATLAKLFRNQRYAVTSKFPRHKLADDGTRFGAGQAIVTPKIIKAELIAQYRLDEFNGLVENATAFKANLIVERASDDPNRINVLYPPDLINQLRIFAVLAQFRLQYNRGVDTAIAV
ncbi:phage tail sheath subtilisin-like domain-containing protein [Bradyrhizobium sp. S3.9.1]|uniref:phage tail sheath subtilisin-like domain-containing protein n=1 Tax=Bradyrhizobium sp. S3.9.1 TaxID=3156431 RepID=UPI003396C993